MSETHEKKSYTIIHQSLPSEQGKTNRKKLKISENLLSSNLPLLPALEGEEPNSTLTRSKNLSIILDELESSQNEKLMELSEGSVYDIQRWITRNYHADKLSLLYNKTNKDISAVSSPLISRLPTVLLSTGSNDWSSNSLAIESLSKLLKNHKCSVVRLNPSHFPESPPSLDFPIKSLIQQIVGIQCEEAEIEILSSWREKEGSRFLSIVIILEGIGKYPQGKLSNFIQLLCESKENLPFSLVLCLGSHPSIFLSSIPSAISSRLLTQCFSLPEPQLIAENALETLFLNPDIPLIPSPECIKQLAIISLFHSSSFTLLKKSIKMMIMEHSFSEPLFPLILSLNPNKSLEEVQQSLREIDPSIILSSLQLLGVEISPQFQAEPKVNSSSGKGRGKKKVRGKKAKEMENKEENGRNEENRAIPLEDDNFKVLGLELIDFREEIKNWRISVKCILDTLKKFKISLEDFPGPPLFQCLLSLSDPGEVLSKNPLISSFNIALSQSSLVEVKEVLELWREKLGPCDKFLEEEIQKVFLLLTVDHSRPSEVQDSTTNNEVDLSSKKGQKPERGKRTATRAQVGMSAEKKRRKLLEGAQNFGTLLSSESREKIMEIFHKLVRGASLSGISLSPLQKICLLSPEPSFIHSISPPIRSLIADSLLRPQIFLNCNCCGNEDGQKNFPPICLVYSLALTQSEEANIADWYAKFVEKLGGKVQTEAIKLRRRKSLPEDDGGGNISSAKKQSMFLQAVSELQVLGLAQPIKRRPNYFKIVRLE